ncbi:MAG: YbgC/FadM family acyl-CoA thioesterase [Legionella sp.]
MHEGATHSHALRVYAEDTDFMGIVFHANYLNFFERARTEMMRDHGLSLTMMAEYDTQFAIRKVQLQFYAAAKLDDILNITSTLTKIKAFKFLFEQKIYNEAKKLLCSAIIEVVCVNQYLKPRRLPIQFFGGDKRG